MTQLRSLTAPASATTKLTAALQIDRFWAIDQTYASAAVGLLDATQADADFRAAYMAGPRADDRPYEIKNRTAILPVCGPMTKAETSMGALFGVCSTVALRRRLAAAMRDDQVDRVVLVFDSPGGQVSGTQDLADAVRSASKPVTAYIDSMCCSAALWVASQCSEIVCNPNALYIGSIGVMTVLYDTSAAYESAGVTSHLIATGPYKGHPSAGVPIPESVIEDCQSQIDAIFDQFCSAVALGRSMDRARVIELATGQTWMAKAALDNGLVDRLATYDDLFGGDSTGAGGSGNMATSLLSKIFGIGGVPPSAVETAPDASVEQNLALLESEVQAAYDQLALSFVESKCAALVAENRLLPASEAAFKSLLGTAIVADNGGRAFARNGQVVLGPISQSVLQFAGSIQPVTFGTVSLPSVVGDKPATVVGDAGVEKETYEEIAARTTEKSKKAREVKI